MDTLTYTQLCEAVEILWPNVLPEHVDWFLERLTHAQIVAIANHVER